MSAMDTDEYEKLIEDLKRSLDFKRLSQDLQAFCPFAALNIERQEIRHSAFLAWCLDPAETHGWGADFLVAFLKATQPELNMTNLYFRNAWAEREWRNIDVVIEVPGQSDESLVVAIEMKVDASQGKDQLRNYRERIETHWPKSRKLYLFLRQKDEEPNDDSWEAIGFATIVDALRHFWDTPPRGDLGALQLLSAYRNLLNRKFVMNSSLEKLARSLWRDHASVLKFLADNRPNQKWYGLMDFLQDKDARMPDGFEGTPGDWLAKKMSPNGKTLKLVDPRNNTLIRFAFEEMLPLSGFNTGAPHWSDGRILMVELYVTEDAIKIQLELGPHRDGDQTLRSEIKNLFQNKAKGREYTMLAGGTVARWNENREIEVTKLVEDIASFGKNLLERVLADGRWANLLNLLLVYPDDRSSR